MLELIISVIVIFIVLASYRFARTYFTLQRELRLKRLQENSES